MAMGEGGGAFIVSKAKAMMRMPLYQLGQPHILALLAKYQYGIMSCKL